VKIDWARRHRLMRLHTCLHLLGSLIPVPVTGCGISPDSARIDFDLPESTLDKAVLTEQLNADQREDAGHHRPHHARRTGRPARPRAHDRAAPPAGTSTIRIIEIPGVDRQPCGGTHVANTGEIGAVTVTKIEKKAARTAVWS
jgi:misacylated tRNA(Ala) deacylase